MKKFLFVPALFLLAFLFLPKQTASAGSCTCQVGTNRVSFVKENNCGVGFAPRCVGGTLQVPLSCVCDDTAADTTCGGSNQFCCNGTTCDVPLICYRSQGGAVCLTQEQFDNLPGQPGGDPLEEQLKSMLCNNETGIKAAIGCIPVNDTDSFVSFILRWAIGVGGGIAFILIIYAGFMIMSSSGNPDRLKAGQELLTSAIMGIIMLIFSVFILKVIGMDILGLNNFGFGQ